MEIDSARSSNPAPPDSLLPSPRSAMRTIRSAQMNRQPTVSVERRMFRLNQPSSDNGLFECMRNSFVRSAVPANRLDKAVRARTTAVLGFEPSQAERWHPVSQPRAVPIGLNKITYYGLTISPNLHPSGVDNPTRAS